MIVFGQKGFYLGKSGCIRAKVVAFVRSGCIWAKVLVFDKIGCIWDEVVLFGQ